MTDSWRLFVGIDVGEVWTAQLAATADRLRRSLGNAVRWVRPELYHVTVVFLGSHPPEGVAPIDEALQSAAATVEPFSLRLLELHQMGRRGAGPLVVGVHDPADGLGALRAALDDRLRARAIPFDAKPLQPHVTLGRPRTGARPFDVPGVNLGGSPPLHVGEVALMKSVLLPAGPRYETVVKAPVGR